MTEAGMKADIKAEMAARGFNIDNPATAGEADKYIEAIAAGIVKHIQANAQAIDGGGTSPANWPIT